MSGLVTEARWDWRAKDIAPFVEHVIEAFGAERVMWGSDWPVLNLTTDYRTWRTTARQLVARLPAKDRALIFGGAAAAFYGVETRETVQ